MTHKKIGDVIKIHEKDGVSAMPMMSMQQVGTLQSMGQLALEGPLANDHILTLTMNGDLVLMPNMAGQTDDPESLKPSLTPYEEHGQGVSEVLSCCTCVEPLPPPTFMRDRDMS